MATSKPPAFAEPLLGALGLRPYFSTVAGPDLDAVGDKATIIRQALVELGRPGRAVMVGDRSHDAIGARANGLACIGVAWGIGDEDELTAAGAIRVVHRPAELASAVDGVLDQIR